MLLFDKFAKCQNSHFFRIWVLQTFGKWCKGTCLTNAPVKWEPQFMSKLFAGTIHRGIFSWVAFVFGSLDWNVAWLVHGQSHREHVALLIFGHQGVGYFIGCRSLIGDRRNSVYDWTLKVWERKRRMGRAKHSSEKGTGDTLAHYCWKN